MAQPVTALLNPEPDDNRTMPACPDFCDSTCPGRADDNGGTHHTSGFRVITLSYGDCGETDWYISASRTDEEFRPGTTDVNLIPDSIGRGAGMTPVEARQLAALLLDAADMADPMPLGDSMILPGLLRLDDELLTEDGWQTITGLTFEKGYATRAYTTQRSFDDTPGWLLDPDEVVRVRRRLHGSCVITFVEPQP